MSNCSRSKDNQKMKFGQLIACNMRNILLKKNTEHVVEKLVSDPFIKNEN